MYVAQRILNFETSTGIISEIITPKPTKREYITDYFLLKAFYSMRDELIVTSEMHYKHVKFFQMNLTRYMPSGYQGADTNRMTLVGYIIYTFNLFNFITII